MFPGTPARHEEVGNGAVPLFAPRGSKKYAVVAISDALTDNIVEVSDATLKEMGLPKGNSILLDPPTKAKLGRLFHESPSAVSSPGGSPTNTIYGASNLGLKCAYIGCVGNDESGYAYINNLRDNDIDTYVSIKEGPSAVCYTLVTEDGQRSFGIDMGVTKQLQPFEILHSLIADAHYLHFSAYEFRGDEPLARATRHAAHVARQRGTRISFDLADTFVLTQNREQIVDFLKDKVDIIFANEFEARAFVGDDHFEKLLDFCCVAIVKLGERGSVAYTHTAPPALVPAYKVEKVRDTNGAGDNFQAGVFYGLLRGLPLPTCMKIGNYLASRVIRRIGAQPQFKIWGIEFLV